MVFKKTCLTSLLYVSLNDELFSYLRIYFQNYVKYIEFYALELLFLLTS